jgi:hypothetical protein
MIKGYQNKIEENTSVKEESKHKVSTIKKVSPLFHEQTIGNGKSFEVFRSGERNIIRTRGK